MSVQTALEEAMKLYSAGKLDQAFKIVSQLVEARPRVAAGQNLLGVILAAQGKKAEAVKAIGRATRLEPRNAQYLSNLGELERQRGKLHEAGIALREALHINPKHPQALNNLGILHYDRKEFQESIDCYAKAAASARNYPEAHNNMGNALRALGRQEEAIDAYQKAILLRANYPEAYNNMASVLRDQGQIPEAEHAYRKAIAQRKDYVEAYVNLAMLLDSNDRSEDALRVLGDALNINQHHLATLVQVARIQFRKNNFEQAEQAARLALRIDPKSAEALAVLGQVLHETDRLQGAVAAFEAALRLKPNMIEINSVYAVCLKSLNRLDDAKAQFEKTLELAPTAYGVYANLADLQKFTPDNPYLLAMERIMAEAADPASDRYMPMHFALGKAYDDTGQYARAFQHYKTGTAQKRAKLKYDESQTLGFMDSIREVFTEAFIRKPPIPGSKSEVPVFIVGMPRSGSTLVEQVLSNHPDTFGAGEIKEFSRQLNMMRGRFPGLPKYPHIVQKMNSGQLNLLGEGYLSKLVALSPGSARITDKLLTNYYFVGLLHILFPKARFIHTKRNPVDTCLSAYTKLFKDDMPHSYDLGELGRYYRKYEELMAHWEAVLPPGVMKTVVYEDVVNDMPTMARELIDFLGLPWSDACLSFHESSRPVKTASVVQVRQPVYSSSVGRWKRYAEELKPLIEALGYKE
ncbi:MAG: tetratricopeptide repeat protein [Aestuariivirga sp.]|nr:tetratricopeptide repeat protein [Aestuariivirga sp.]